MHLKEFKKQESGSIMLEVVAVLALMGVMGAMLFRQIYQRNQELHNIQMASEIRTVKEAFSAYVQANRAELAHKCTAGGVARNVNLCAHQDTQSAALAAAVTDYLPEGWFNDDNPLGSAYNFYLYSYMDASNRQVVYGMVVPTDSTLPESNWNFKRAARVALLIGADGGAYGPGITGGGFSGSLGSWDMPTTGVAIPTDEHGNKPLYAAITGVDIFAPEYEPPEGTVNLREDWDLALHDLHAYNNFTVGNSVAVAPGDIGCYDIHHTTTGDVGGVQKPDNDDIRSLSENCKPLFWVENGTTGEVNVATDLNIGEVIEDPDHPGNYIHNEALKLTKEGKVVQKDGLTIGTDGRIIAHNGVSAAVGDLQGGENYVLDPAYTSTMNDIRLASRGGVRLSEILPNYILKDQLLIHSCYGMQSDAVNGHNCVIPQPDCPSGYKKSLVVIPFRNNVEQNATADLSNLKVDASGDITGTTTFPVTITGHTQMFVTIKKEDSDGAVTPGAGNTIANSSSGAQWHVVLHDENGDVRNMRAMGFVYCVFDSSVYGTKPECEAAGWKWSGSCTSTRLTEAERVGKLERSENSCKEAGYFWDDTKKRCRGNYAEAATINGYGDNALKEKACKAAGRTWNSGNHSCTN